MNTQTTLVRSVALSMLLCSFSQMNQAWAQIASITAQPTGTTTCATTNAGFSVVANDAISYQWQENRGAGFSNLTEGGIYSGTNTAALTLTAVTDAMNAYTYRVVVTGNTLPAVNSNAVTLTVNNTWTGALNSSWSSAANWSCSVLPTLTSNVVIPSGTTFNPIVNIPSAVCNNLTINSGASLTYTAGSNALEVKGTFTNNGSFNGSSGKLKLSGTAQQIPSATYKDLEIAGGGSKTIAGSINVSGVLTFTSGYLVLGTSSLTIGNSGSVSGASRTSFVVINSTGQMRFQNVGTGGKTGAVTFPIGTSTSSYTPVSITNTGTIDIFSARVINGVNSSYSAGDLPNGTNQNVYNVGKTWLLSEGTAGGSNATLNFSWEDMDEQPGFNNGACYVGHYYLGRWNTDFPAKTANGFSPYDLSVSGIKSFSPFAIGSQFSLLESGFPLPLDLLSFNGRNTTAGAKLTWITANEKDVAGFEVERSEDGKNYNRISQVAAKGTASGETEATYSYTDATKPSVSKCYYRLKMLDIDGSYKYSNIVVIKNSLESTPAISLYPNPATGDDVFVQLNGFNAKSLEVKIITVTGQILYHNMIDAASLNAGVVPVSVKKLPAGAYYMQVNDGENIESLRFTKL